MAQKKIIQSERMTQFLCQKQIGDFTGQGSSSKNNTDQKADEMPNKE